MSKILLNEAKLEVHADDQGAGVRLGDEMLQSLADDVDIAFFDALAFLKGKLQEIEKREKLPQGILSARIAPSN